MEENNWLTGSSESLPDQEHISGSPASSQGSSQRRVVEILSNDRGDANPANNNWTLRPEFFDEDLGLNSGNIPGDLSDFDEDDIDEAENNNNEDNNNEQEDGGSFGVFSVEDIDGPPRVERNPRPVQVINISENNVDINPNADIAEEEDDDDDDVNDADYVADLDEVDDVDDDDDDLEDYDSEDDPDLIHDLDEVEGGFVLARPDIISDDEEEDDEDNGGREVRDYDRAVPATHRYLGDELEESRGCQVMVENTVVRLSLINTKENIIFPGQTIPLAGMQFRIQRALRECIHTNNRTVGCISHPSKNQIGVTAEIRNYYVPPNDHDDHDNGMRLILEGRQRFRLLSPPFETTIQGDVRILPEISLGRPYRPLATLSRFFTSHEVADKFIIWKYPPWLARQFEARSVIKQIMNHIKDWNNADLAQDPCEFSYWVASNLPLSNQDRRKALSFCATEARLKWILELLNRSELLACCGCDTRICHKDDIFSMSQSGPQNNFVNAHGYNHDTLTVRNASSLIVAYEWSSEFSWFPPYKWRMAHCENCNRHIGWCYKHPDPNVKPRKFYGLSRANVRLYMDPGPEIQMPMLEALRDLHSLAQRFHE